MLEGAYGHDPHRQVENSMSNCQLQDRNQPAMQQNPNLVDSFADLSGFHGMQLQIVTIFLNSRKLQHQSTGISGICG